MVIGLLAGYLGGAFDMASQRLIDIMLAFPDLLLALAIVAVLGPSLMNVMIAVGVGSVPIYARLVRAQVLSLKEREYVESARACGAVPLTNRLRPYPAELAVTTDRDVVAGDCRGDPGRGRPVLHRDGGPGTVAGMGSDAVVRSKLPAARVVDRDLPRHRPGGDRLWVQSAG